MTDASELITAGIIGIATKALYDEIGPPYAMDFCSPGDQKSRQNAARSHILSRAEDR